MSFAPTLEAEPDRLAELRAKIGQMEGRGAGRPLATHPALSGLVQLRSGGVYGVDSASLLLTALAGPSADGAWCGVVGSADLGLEAAVEAGVVLERTVWVPEPGESWLEVLAALIDVVGVVAVRPPSRVGAKDASRIAARLRNRQSALIAWGDWPRADARLRLGDVRWSGLGNGHGHLTEREVRIELAGGFVTKNPRQQVTNPPLRAVS